MNFEIIIFNQFYRESQSTTVSSIFIQRLSYVKENTTIGLSHSTLTNNDKKYYKKVLVKISHKLTKCNTLKFRNSLLFYSKTQFQQFQINENRSFELLFALER